MTDTSGFCCEMRAYFLLVPMRDPRQEHEPTNVLDFVRLGDDGKPMLFTRFCPWCGKEIPDGEQRRYTSASR